MPENTTTVNSALRGLTIVAVVAAIALVIYRVVTTSRAVARQARSSCANAKCGCQSSPDCACHCTAAVAPHHHDAVTGAALVATDPSLGGIGGLVGAELASGEPFTNYRDLLGPYTGFREIEGLYPGYSLAVHPIGRGASPEMAWLMANQRAQEESAAARLCPPMPPPARQQGPGVSPQFHPFI